MSIRFLLVKIKSGRVEAKPGPSEVFVAAVDLLELIREKTRLVVEDESAGEVQQVLKQTFVAASESIIELIDATIAESMRVAEEKEKESSGVVPASALPPGLKGL